MPSPDKDSIAPRAIKTHQAIQMIPTMLQKIIDTMLDAQAQPEMHVPTLAPLQDGAWGTICLACTTEAGTYVQECQKEPDVALWPAAILYPHPQDESKVKAVITACRGVMMDRPDGDPEYVLARRLLVLLGAV